MTEPKKGMQTKKPPEPTCAELRAWLKNEYLPWYEKKTGVHTTDDGNPDLPPPPPPGHGK